MIKPKIEIVKPVIVNKVPIASQPRPVVKQQPVKPGISNLMKPDKARLSEINKEIVQKKAAPLLSAADEVMNLPDSPAPKKTGRVPKAVADVSTDQMLQEIKKKQEVTQAQLDKEARLKREHKEQLRREFERKQKEQEEREQREIELRYKQKEKELKLEQEADDRELKQDQNHSPEWKKGTELDQLEDSLETSSPKAAHVEDETVDFKVTQSEIGEQTINFKFEDEPEGD